LALAFARPEFVQEGAMKELLPVTLAFLMAGVLNASAQAFPSHPITMVLPFPPGAGIDVVTRTIAEHMKASLGQPIVVENAAGAGGTVATARVMRASPDGYTLSIGNLGTHVVSPATYPNIQYHPLNDFEPVAMFGTTAYWLVARKDLPPKDLSELIAWLKANPDKVSAGMVGSGGIDQIAGTLFQQKTGTRFQFVPYRGVAPLVQDLIAGQIDIWFGAAFGAFGQVRGGQLKAYAVLADSRWSAAPDIPSTAETDLPELTVPFWIGMWAPKGTPRT
jgi:tripartite-type tricarboxylate transporter receptor subunit TctC